MVSKTPKNHGKSWTPADEAALRRLDGENALRRVLGLRLSPTEAFVRGKVAELGLSLKLTNQSPYNRRQKS